MLKSQVSYCNFFSFNIKYDASLWNLILKDYILQKKLQNGNAGISHELKLAYSGTEEFKKAQLLRDLHTEFTFHLERLHKRLATEEKKILQPSPASV